MDLKIELVKDLKDTQRVGSLPDFCIQFGSAIEIEHKPRTRNNTKCINCWTPLLGITFKQIEMANINKAIQESKANIYPLRNYFIVKQKGPEKENRIFSLMTGPDEQKSLNFYIKAKRSFLEKLSSLGKPRVVARVEIESFQNLVRVCRMEKLVLETEDEGVKISELLESYNEELGGIIKLNFSKDTSFQQILYLYQIMKNSWGDLRFTWNVEIHCENAFQGAFLIENRTMEWEDEEGKDVKIVAANGGEIKCHSEILTSKCATFKSMLSPEFKMLEAEQGRIEMRGNSEEGLCQFVRLLYGFQMPLESADLTLELLQLSNKYAINVLEQYLIDFLGSKGGGFYTADALLELFFFARNFPCLEELKIHSLIEMSIIGKEQIESCEYFQGLESKFAEEVCTLLMEWN